MMLHNQRILKNIKKYKKYYFNIFISNCINSRENIKTLLENKTAYYCFCSENRMNLLRREAVKNGHVPKYDNKCRHSTDSEVNEKLRNGVPYCIRFKVHSR